MVDQLTLQTIGIMMTGISLTIAAAYYTLTLRNTQKTQQLQLETRQAQLLSTLFETYRSQEFRNQWSSILNQVWTDFDDFWEKYGLENNPEEWSNWQAVASFFHGVGILLKKGLIEIGLLEELLAPVVFMAWVVMGPIIKGFEEYIERESVRTRFRDFERLGVSKRYKSWSGFEYLYNELRKREE
jgi:hypothetical protein